MGRVARVAIVYAITAVLAVIMVLVAVPALLTRASRGAIQDNRNTTQAHQRRPGAAGGLHLVVDLPPARCRMVRPPAMVAEPNPGRLRLPSDLGHQPDRPMATCNRRRQEPPAGEHCPKPVWRPDPHAGTRSRRSESTPTTNPSPARRCADRPQHSVGLLTSRPRSKGAIPDGASQR